MRHIANVFIFSYFDDDNKEKILTSAPQSFVIISDVFIAILIGVK